MSRTADEIKSAVQERYGARARAVAEQPADAAADAGCCGPDDKVDYRDLLYGVTADNLPETAFSLGCGNPTALAGLKTGETILDLGSGAGLDCFLSAKAVGPTGHVIGLDMTPDMLKLANENKAKLGAGNVEFRRGEMENMPVDDATIDVIISNCVINLSPDKDAVFRESFRVLRPGGRFHVSDIVLARPLSEAERDDLALWAGCAAGALVESDYLGRLVQAGFSDLRVEKRSKIGDKAWYSATIAARKPVDAVTPERPPVARVSDTSIPVASATKSNSCC